MFDALTFLVDTGFDFTDVGGSGIFFKKNLAFILVELRWLLEKIEIQYHYVRVAQGVIGYSDAVKRWAGWA